MDHSRFNQRPVRRLVPTVVLVVRQIVLSWNSVDAVEPTELLDDKVDHPRRLLPLVPYITTDNERCPRTNPSTDLVVTRKTDHGPVEQLRQVPDLDFIPGRFSGAGEWRRPEVQVRDEYEDRGVPHVGHFPLDNFLNLFSDVRSC